MFDRRHDQCYTEKLGKMTRHPNLIGRVFRECRERVVWICIESSDVGQRSLRS